MTVTIVTFIWPGNRNYLPEHVALMAAGLKRHMTSDYRFVCITDDTNGDFGGAEVMETPMMARRLGIARTPEAERFPSCYRRLWLFSEEARVRFGPGRVMLTDVDALVTGDWTPLFDYPNDFVGWYRPKGSWGDVERRVAGGTWLLRTGTRTEVYDDFIRDTATAIRGARGAGYRGSDQAWISYKLAEHAFTWPEPSGIYSIRDFTRKNRGMIVTDIPDDAKVVHFNGLYGPWDREMQIKHPWVGDYL